MKHAIDPDEDEKAQLIAQVRSQDATIRELRNRIVKLEEVEGINRDLVAMNGRLLERIKEMKA